MLDRPTTPAPGEQIRVMRGVLEKQIADAIETFEKTSGIGIEDVHVSRIKGSANSRFTLTCDLGS